MFSTLRRGGPRGKRSDSILFSAFTQGCSNSILAPLAYLVCIPYDNSLQESRVSRPHEDLKDVGHVVFGFQMFGRAVWGHVVFSQALSTR